MQGKVVALTGASRGIGAASARVFAEAGARVALLARDQTALTEVAAEVGRRGGAEALPVRCDVTREDEVHAAAGAVRERLGRAHILVNSAGINLRKPLTEFSLAEWRLVLDTNLTGVFLTCRESLRLLVHAGARASIVCTSSPAAFVGF